MPRKNRFDPITMRHDKAKRHEYYLKNHRWINYYKRWKRSQNAKVLKEEIFRVLGNKCLKCGFSDSRALQIDHVNGGGVQETKLWWYRNKEAYYRRILSEPQRYQILCANCNWIKRSVNHEYDQAVFSWEELKAMAPKDREETIRNFKPLEDVIFACAQ